MTFFFFFIINIISRAPRFSLVLEVNFSCHVQEMRLDLRPFCLLFISVFGVLPKCSHVCKNSWGDNRLLNVFVEKAVRSFQCNLTGEGVVTFRQEEGTRNNMVLVSHVHL